MPAIRPSVDLHNNYHEISSLCHQYDEPVFITVNGKGDLAVMSIEAFEMLKSKAELYQLLNEGLLAMERGEVYSREEVINDLLKELEA